MKAHDLPTMQREAGQLLRQLRATSPADRPDVRRVVSEAVAEAPRWFDGKPARRLLAYLQQMQTAAHLAPADAAGELLSDLLEEGGTSLLVLHPVMRAERLADYAQRRAASPGWGLARDWVDDDGRPVQVLQVNRAALTASRVRLNLDDLTPEKALAGAVSELATYWVAQLKAGRVDGLDRPPGLSPGAVLGMLEADAARLWPALSGSAAQAVRQLHAVPTPEDRAEQWTAACEGCKPPDGFGVPPPGRKRFLWQPAHRAELLQQFEVLEAACGKQAPALVELHQRWGYAVPKSDKGGSLTKVLTKAREERDARQPRRSVKTRR